MAQPNRNHNPEQQQQARCTQSRLTDVNSRHQTQFHDERLNLMLEQVNTQYNYNDLQELNHQLEIYESLKRFLVICAYI